MPTGVDLLRGALSQSAALNRKTDREYAGNTYVTIEYQGLGMMLQDLWAMGQIIMAGAPPVLALSADVGVDYAKELVPVDTGLTRSTISIAEPGVVEGGMGNWWIRYGAETDYAPALEWGTDDTAPRPFITPSGDLAGAVLARSMASLMNMVASGRFSGGGMSQDVSGDPRVASAFTKYRSFLYDSSKLLGDIAVFGGREILGGPRRAMLGLARSLGDISASVGGTVGQRVTHRLSGRVTGHLVGFGSHSLSASRTYSGFAGGTGGHRVYQRVAGRFGGSAATNLNSLLP
jgi:hypothetical protein